MSVGRSTADVVPARVCFRSVLVELRKMLHGTGLVFQDHDARIVDGCSEGRYLFHAVNEALGKLGRSDGG